MEGKDYNQLDVYLQKFKKILSQTSFQKETIVSVISNEIKNEIKNENIKIKNNVVTLVNMSGVLRNEIFLHKEKILKELKEKGLNISGLR